MSSRVIECVIVFALICAIVFCGFGLTQALKQGRANAAWAERCEASGGVYYRAKYEARRCFKPDAFIEVRP